MRVRNRHGKIADAHQASHWRSTRRRGLVSVWAMRDESLGFLRDLINTPSPPGHEGRGQRVWLNYVEAYADETFTDAYGNAVATLNKGGSPRLMLAGHADE